MKPLHADQLRDDPRITRARQLVHEALREHPEVLTGIKPPNRNRRLSYEKLMDSVHFAWGYPLWLPYVGSRLGRGALVELADGSLKYAFIAGSGTQFGHSLPQLAVTLMERFVRLSGLDHCFLTISGAMNREKCVTDRVSDAPGTPTHILAFSHCLMGRTCTLSQIIRREQRKPPCAFVGRNLPPFGDHRR